MIDKHEIIAVADQTGLIPTVVEKDYVLGWLLAAVDANYELKNSWVFKGGTCLKKCYFETYRFSEDLDFTLRNEATLEEAFFLEQFSEIADWLYERCGIVLPIDKMVFDIYENPRGHLSCQGRVYYQSYFSKGKGSYPKVKFDLTKDELLVLPPSRQLVFHPYSDTPSDGIYIHCYSYPEVFAEKIRALGERGRPRDLYDVINLFRNEQFPASSVIQNILSQKCSYKEITVPSLKDLDNYKDEISRNWEPMLCHQLPSLPPLETYWETLPEFFQWLASNSVDEKSSLEVISKEGDVYHLKYNSLAIQMKNRHSLEIIRFAAGNRLCVELDYTDQKGQQSTRTIEPYSLRKAKNGKIFLYGVRTDNEEIRSYDINRINGASIINKVFKARYQVEFSYSHQ